MHNQKSTRVRPRKRAFQLGVHGNFRVQHLGDRTPRFRIRGRLLESGIIRVGQNCAFISLVQFLESDRIRVRVADGTPFTKPEVDDPYVVQGVLDEETNEEMHR